MALTKFFAVCAIIVIGCEAVPCPQFLPVAVRLEPQPINTFSLKTVVKVKDEKTNAIPKDADSNLIFSPSDTAKPALDDVGNEEIKTLRIKPSSSSATQYQKQGSNAKPLKPTLEILKSASSTTISSATASGQKQKKRRRSRPKESKKIILSQNTGWALKTINDKPAMDVLVTDKASIARDLNDSTESPLVSVKKLEEQSSTD